MTTSAQTILDAFEKLSTAEKREVATEILRRSGDGEGPDEAYAELADQVFATYDREEE